ncbi:DUF1129 family protein [Fictibacillus phosphorivorans]|uniref:DUF1129 family protein n=1 Tax=Fictibacillus phosphorivorans TaxID=1221500 RepID=UPI00203BC486|nr:DUF1129 family protein [Fictibacillus phosphorivorans]MCM3717619.1 DUF1129 family protein [Fictibacillus phosphorivorans]MCM3775519.1 DUF1129 family protein [Fictibacillus phosphorivorans]
MNVQPNKLSKRSEDFLDNLRLYLTTSGKKEDEIEDIVSELEDHLLEAEKHGKSTEDIIGHSPKTYMEQLSKEMPVDFMALIKYVPVLLLGVFAYILLGDAIRSGVKYSLIQVIGYPLLCLILLVVYMKIFKYTASMELSKTANGMVLFLIGCLPITLFIGLLILNDRVDSPMIIHLGIKGNIAAAFIAVLIFVSISIWSKTWFTIIIPVLLFTPELLIKMTSLNQEMKLILTVTIPFILIGIYFYMSYRKEKAGS